MWRVARALYDVAQESSCPKDEAKLLTYASLQAAREALRLGPDNGKCHKWFGIALNATGDFEGTKASISNAYVIREHWEKAVELDPKDATSLHLLGRWAFALASLSWTSRKMASLIFGTPPAATFEEALAYFERSEAISPGGWKKNSCMVRTAAEI